jgi:hypothetical protein
MNDLDRRMLDDPLTQSLIDLERQAEKLSAMVDEGTQRWAGATPKSGLQLTGKAMLADLVKFGDRYGCNEWTEKKRQTALDAIAKSTTP